MDYRGLAEKLIDLHTRVRLVPAIRELSAADRGMFAALSCLMAHGKTAYPSQLCREMGVSSARVAALLHQMEKHGLVTRTMDLHDNRKTVVSLTGQGERLIQQKYAEMVAIVSETLEQLGAEDAEAYLRIEAKIVRNLKSRT